MSVKGGNLQRAHHNRRQAIATEFLETQYSEAAATGTIGKVVFLGKAAKCGNWNSALTTSHHVIVFMRHVAKFGHLPELPDAITPSTKSSRPRLFLIPPWAVQRR
jgi:hypothetical protein